MKIEILKKLNEEDKGKIIELININEKPPVALPYVYELWYNGKDKKVTLTKCMMKRAEKAPKDYPKHFKPLMTDASIEIEVKEVEKA